MPIAYDCAYDAMMRERVAVCIPAEDGESVTVFEVVPGPPFSHPSQTIREMAHITMAVKARQKMAQDAE